MPEKEKIDCVLFPGEYCTSKTNCKNCHGKFYRCSKINTTKYYHDCVNKFLSNPDIIHIDKESFRADFRDKDDRKKQEVDCRVINGEPRKPIGKDVPTDTDPKNKNEDFLCRCYYRCYNGICQRKDCKERFSIPESDYKIIDYQIPPLNGNCGKVDIVLHKEGENEVYLTEVKPKDSHETLLRMILEILTHVQCLVNNDKFKKYCEDKHGINNPEILPAIMFFKDSWQEKEYSGHNTKIDEIIKRHKISVFCCDEETKIITKLN